ncbi:MAG: alpha/beta hydrolase-fold protein [Calothrix sp. MO_167.B42]|nr:alpha/beta hydrolase-fold protein [Calothrix sp. MO_167.B42]
MNKITSFYIAFIISLICSQPVYAQLKNGSRAPSNVPNKEYPYIHSDGKVTFRVKAPLAKTVQVVGLDSKNPFGKKPTNLIRGEDGLWMVTIPINSGFHYYQLIIDGTPVNDPASKTYFGWGKATSGLEVPDPKVDFYNPKVATHGEVRQRWYHSQVTGKLRRVLVYTPPNYNANIKRRYPVLYLQHGAGESEQAWTQQGKANFILDNLINTGKAVPMIVVMDNGYATKPGVKLPPDSWKNEAFPLVVIQDLIPLIDSQYRTIAHRNSRAIAGLSMGGGQALEVGLNNLDKFSSVGGFSSLLKNFNVDTSYGGVFQNPTLANLKLKLFWLGCGTQDNFYSTHQTIHRELEKAGIRHVWFPTEGGHEWLVWRGYLREFTSILFRY